MTKRVALVIAGVFVVALLVGAGLAYWLKPSEDVHVRVNVDQIRNISQLATVEYRLSADVRQTFKSNVGFGIKKVSDMVIATCTGTVTGRADLEKATVTIDEEGRTVLVHFDRGSIVISNVEIDPDDPEAFRAISCREELDLGGFYNPSALKPATSGQRQGMQRLAIKEIRVAALKTGIVDKTQANAKTALAEFLSAFGYKVTVTFDEKAYDPPAA